MRIALVMQGRPRRHPIWSEVGDVLEARGAEVRYLWPDAELTDLACLPLDHDLYVIKSGSPLGMSYAAALHAAGATTFNPYPVAATCRDKIVVSHVLAAAGVPVPDTWVTEDAALLPSLLADGPLVIKPYRGSRGVGVTVVRSESGLRDVEAAEGPLFAQRYHAPDGDGLDHKIYVIGGEVHGVRRVWPSRTWEDKLGRPFVPDATIREIAGRCATAIGTDTFGFDVVFSRGVPYVVDISALPGFKGVPDATSLLAGAIHAAAARALGASLEAAA